MACTGLAPLVNLLQYLPAADGGAYRSGGFQVLERYQEKHKRRQEVIVSFVILSYK